MLGLFAIGIWQTITKRLNNVCFLIVENATHLIARDCFFTLILLLFIGSAEASALPRCEALNETIQRDSAWADGHGTRMFDLPEKPFTNRHGDVIELSALVAADSQPMTKQKTNEKTNASEKLSSTADDIMNLLKDWKVQKIFLWFLFGVFCGGGFGEPPFARSSYRKPNDAVEKVFSWTHRAVNQNETQES